MPSEKWFTVVAIYEDNLQRYATSVEAVDPDEAEELARGSVSSPIIVAGVLAGRHATVDTGDNPRRAGQG